jgi:hypothetical protein
MEVVMRLFLLALLAVFPFATHAAEVPDVSEALDAYVEALEAGDAPAVVALYDKDAIFYSMLAVKPLKTQAQRLSYYKKVVTEPDLSVDIDESNPKVVGNMATNEGVYTFHHTEEGEDIAMPAQFSFAYILKNGKWLITQQRSTKIEGKRDIND